MDLRILGPLEISVDDCLVEVRAAKVRALLAMLILHANEVVSTERLIDAISAGSPPVSAANTLQTYVSQLRNLLEPDRRTSHPPKILHTRPPGYLLRSSGTRSTPGASSSSPGAGRRALVAGDAANTTTALAEALALWRGDALAEFAYAEFAREAITRLEELRHSAEEDRMEAELMLGHHLEALGDIKALTAAAPLRERRWKQLIIALYRVGHQAEALRAYQALRRTLADELGLDPSPDLQRLEAAVLAQDSRCCRRPPSRRAPLERRLRCCPVAFGKPGGSRSSVARASLRLLRRSGNGRRRASSGWCWWRGNPAWARPDWLPKLRLHPLGPEPRCSSVAATLSSPSPTNHSPKPWPT